ncbi:MAG: 50S ribosomal protein L21 [Desulfosalsimonadaceae bacterium]
MYAVIATGGKQYKVNEGDILRIEKIAGDIGDAVSMDRVLMVAEGDNVTIGTPVVDNAVVNASIVEQAKAKKVLVFKYKRRKRFRRKQGHRQPFTAIRIENIVNN